MNNRSIVHNLNKNIKTNATWPQFWEHIQLIYRINMFFFSKYDGIIIQLSNSIYDIILCRKKMTTYGLDLDSCPHDSHIIKFVMVGSCLSTHKITIHMLCSQLDS